MSDLISVRVDQRESELELGDVGIQSLDNSFQRARFEFIVSIQEELGVPVKYIGVGEEIEDLQPFEPADFVQALLGQ